MPDLPCALAGCRLESPPKSGAGMSSQAYAGDRQGARKDLAKRAIDLAMKSRWAEAVNTNRAILAEFPNDVGAYNRMGKAPGPFQSPFVVSLSNHNWGLRQAQAERQGTTLSQQWKGPGKALAEAGRVVEARAAFSRVLDLSPHNPIAKRTSTVWGSSSTASPARPQARASPAGYSSRRAASRGLLP